MRRSGRPSVTLSDAEKARLGHCFEAIEMRLTELEETLQIACWRSGANITERDENRIARARQALGDLAQTVAGTPIEPD